jgi:hypothetical protein
VLRDLRFSAILEGRLSTRLGRSWGALSESAMGHDQSRNFEDGLPLSAGNRLQDSAHDPRRTLASHDQLDGSAPSPVRSKTDLRQNSLYVRHRARNDDISTSGIHVRMIARIILRPGTPMFAW